MSQEGSSNQLAVFRVLLGMQIFYASHSLLLDLLQVVDGTSRETIFPEFIDVQIALIAVPYLQITVQVLSVFMVLGLFTRYIMPLLFVSVLLLFSYWYSKYDAPVQWLYIWFPLLILCFGKPSDALSLDRLFNLTQKPGTIRTSQSYRWPIELVSGWFAYIYVAAGLAKILPFEKGVTWLDGGTSHKIIYYRFLDSALFYLFEKPFFDYSSNQWVFSALSVGSLFIELSCIVIFFTNRFNKWVLAGVILMHFFLYLTGVPGFMQTALVLGVCLLPPRVFTLPKWLAFNQ